MDDLCEHCGKGPLVEGQLDGVSFTLASQVKKLLSSGLYGIQATVCRSCGRLSNLRFDLEVLAKRFSDPQ